MNTSNRLLLYKSILQTIYYGLVESTLWGLAKPSNTRIIQAFRAIFLRMTINAPWYVTNVSSHNELKIATIPLKQLPHSAITCALKRNIFPIVLSLNATHSNHLPGNPVRHTLNGNDLETSYSILDPHCHIISIKLNTYVQAL